MEGGGVLKNSERVQIDPAVMKELQGELIFHLTQATDQRIRRVRSSSESPGCLKGDTSRPADSPQMPVWDAGLQVTRVLAAAVNTDSLLQLQLLLLSAVSWLDWKTQNRPNTFNRASLRGHVLHHSRDLAALVGSARLCVCVCE